MTEDIDFPLSDIGEGLAEATIVRWLVAEGAPVRRFDPMVEIETAKSVTEIPSPVTGVVVHHGAVEGEVLEVGRTLAILRADAEEVLRADREVGADTTQTKSGVALHLEGDKKGMSEKAEPSAKRVRTTGRRVAAVPKARARAAALGIAIESITGSGPEGQVLLSDVDRAAASTGPKANERPENIDRSEGSARVSRTERLTPMRSAIAATLSKAWSSVPLITELREIEATGLVATHAARRAGASDSVSYTALFSWISLQALKQHPGMNASLDAEAGTITYHGAVHLGVAVSVPGGLTVVVVRDADLLSLDDLAVEIASLARVAREGTFSSDQVRDATFTVTSFGQFGGWFGTPLVVPPQVAIAGFGIVKDRVVAVNGLPTIRPILPLSVSVDHRAVDGAELSAFCGAIEAYAAGPLEK